MRPSTESDAFLELVENGAVVGRFPLPLVVANSLGVSATCEGLPEQFLVRVKRSRSRDSMAELRGSPGSAGDQHTAVKVALAWLRACVLGGSPKVDVSLDAKLLAGIETVIAQWCATTSLTREQAVAIALRDWVASRSHDCEAAAEEEDDEKAA